MQVCVSPTGNGLLLGTSLEDAMRFLAPDGTVLREVTCAQPQAIWPADERPGASHVQLRSSSRSAAGRRTWLWLPLAHVVGPETERVRTSRREPEWTDVAEATRWPPFGDEEKRWLLRMLTWSPERGRFEQAAVERQLTALRADDPAAAQALLDLGLSAEPVLRAALAAQPDEARLLQPILDRITARLCGHQEPWRHRELLAALQQHPDGDLRACAVGRLRALDDK